MADKTYALSAETEAEMEDWIKVLDKVRTAAETLSQISLDRQRGKNVGGVVGTLSHMFNILFGYKMEILSFQNNPKDLDPS